MKSLILLFLLFSINVQAQKLCVTQGKKNNNAFLDSKYGNDYILKSNYWFLGNSITYASWSFSYQVSLNKKAIEVNLSIPGTKASGIISSQITPYMRQKTYNDKYVWCAIGVNDVRTSVDTATYRSGLMSIISSLKALGWDSTNIIIPTIFYITDYGTGSLALMTACNNIIKNIWTTKHMTYRPDIWQFMHDGGGSSWVNGDGIHTNTAGHIAIGQYYSNNILPAGVEPYVKKAYPRDSLVFSIQVKDSIKAYFNFVNGRANYKLNYGDSTASYLGTNFLKKYSNGGLHTCKAYRNYLTQELYYDPTIGANDGFYATQLCGIVKCDLINFYNLRNFVWMGHGPNLTEINFPASDNQVLYQFIITDCPLLLNLDCAGLLGLQGTFFCNNINLNSLKLPNFLGAFTTFDCSNCALDQTSINNIYSKLDAYYSVNTPKSALTIATQGGTNAAPTMGSSNTNIVHLQSLFSTAGKTLTINKN
jgi:hypothetical protein